MNKLSLKILSVTFIFLFVVSSFTIAFAQDSGTGKIAPGQGTGNVAPVQIFTLSNPLKVDSIGGLIQALVEIFTYIAILFAVVMFIYIGFQYIYNASKGNASEITKLHGQLMWLIVGVAIVIAARVIVQVVINTLQATNVVSPGVIESANKAIRGN